MQVWALHARDLGYIGNEVAERWRSEYREIARMLCGLYREQFRSLTTDYCLLEW